MPVLISPLVIDDVPWLLQISVPSSLSPRERVTITTTIQIDDYGKPLVTSVGNHGEEGAPA